MSVRWTAAAGTHVGKVRQSNEDSYRVDETRGVFLVADGMGGHAAGEVASALAVKEVGEALEEALDARADWATLEAVLHAAYQRAHRAIAAHTAAAPDTRGMGTTLTSLILCDDGAYRIGHVGDSRAYLLRAGKLAQLTTDHTWVQRQVDAGVLTPSAARRHHLSHVITRALGADSGDEPDLLAGRFGPGDTVLLASDGLTGMVPDRTLGTILRSGHPPDDVVQRLIDEANARGGADNVTAVLIGIHPA